MRSNNQPGSWLWTCRQRAAPESFVHFHADGCIHSCSYHSRYFIVTFHSPSPPSPSQREGRSSLSTPCSPTPQATFCGGHLPLITGSTPISIMYLNFQSRLEYPRCVRRKTVLRPRANVPQGYYPFLSSSAGYFRTVSSGAGEITLQVSIVVNIVNSQCYRIIKLS